MTYSVALINIYSNVIIIIRFVDPIYGSFAPLGFYEREGVLCSGDEECS
jgi:hypothetical protein